MIKQIWFVRNVKKLINYICVTAGAFILFYSLLCVLALGEGLELNALLAKYGIVIVVPVIQLAISLIFLWLYKRTDKMSSAVSTININFIRKMLCGTNLIIALTLFFAQINGLSLLKGIESFGVFPIYLTIAGGIVFYIITIIQCCKTKENKNGI